MTEFSYHFACLCGHGQNEHHDADDFTPPDPSFCGGCEEEKMTPVLHRFVQARTGGVIEPSGVGTDIGECTVVPVDFGQISEAERVQRIIVQHATPIETHHNAQPDPNRCDFCALVPSRTTVLMKSKRSQTVQAIHVLVANGARRAPYADRTVCGIDLVENENTPAIWDWEQKDRKWLAPDKWEPKGYRWCSRCQKNTRVRQAMSGTKLGIRLYTKGDEMPLSQGADILRATHKLLAEVEKSITGKKHAEIEWVLTAFHYMCDGCDIQRPVLHDDWHHVDVKDYCASCWEKTQLHPQSEVKE